ncbi:prolyl oligopeptidase family serine peptidase [Halosquirtibacter xylanolyticus]|uniref:S9 family peptidase n=1 Tax=Halosquirtibacter xylanolyticus TaxID=3374599 RepID=UPI003749D935|nr:prolyl oligopeptidase family serine peptidase [Prolixibacteraceae bacterium]
MNKLFTCIVAYLICIPIGLAHKGHDGIKEWNIVNIGQLHLPAFSKQGDVDYKKTTYKQVLSSYHTEFDKMALNPSLKWEQVVETEITKHLTLQKNLFLLETNIETGEWVKTSFDIKINNPTKIYLDHKLIKEYKDTASTTLKIPMKLTLGSHHLTIAMAQIQEKSIFESSLKKDDHQISYTPTSSQYKRVLSLEDLLDGTKISSAKLSPSGNYYAIILKDLVKGKGHYRYQVRNFKTKRIIKEWRYESLISFRWEKYNDILVYGKEGDVDYDIVSYNPVNAETKIIYTGIKKLNYFYLSPHADKIFYTQNIYKEKKEDLKRIYTPDDRIAKYRNRYGLRMVDLNTMQDMQLTAGYLTASLQDINPNGDKIIFSTKQQDCSDFPFYRMKMYEMDLNTFKIDTLFNKQDDDFGVTYSPDGKKLVYQANPTSFDGIGINIQTDHKANTFDAQLFIYDRETETTTAITKDFNPSVSSFEWAGDNTLYILCSDRDKKSIYKYQLDKKEFTLLETPVDVIYSFSIDNKSRNILYYGTSITKDVEVYAYNIKKKSNRLIAQSTNVTDKQIQLGQTEEYDFKNHNDDTIYGRIYYPPHYDQNKKYPVIVYYYGGTSPTVRSFGGRYPKNLWAARGYIVYVLQPSGATGFGQNFSSYHVNGWGKDAIDDIIQGTKSFLKSHPSADAKNVGCIGASYGGFTTMMLQTRTDLFKTAISHAGISDITSYWGEGYWGYSYNTIAATGSYPWNNQNLFIAQSPLFRADKFQNSILLLHGTADTNVPVGESKQFYLALKLLKKDAEMVLVDGENHWIIDYTKRKQWHQTIVSWFDFKLKDQPQQWESLYPKKQL